MAFNKNYLSAQSQPWAREVQKRVANLETSFRSAEVNNTTRDDQLAASFRRLDATFLETKTANENAIEAINRILGLGEPDGDAIDGVNIIDESVDGAKIVANSVTADQIEAGTITATQISSEYVYAGNISATQINAGTISGSRVAGGTIVGTQLKTATTNRRIELESTQMSIYDENDEFSGSILGEGTDSGAIVKISGTGDSFLGVLSAGVLLSGSPASNLTVSSGGISAVGNFSFSDGNVTMLGDEPTFTMLDTGASPSRFGSFKLNAQNQFEASGWRAINDMNVGGDLFVSMDVDSGSTVRVTSGNKLVKSSSSLRYKEQIELLDLDYDLLTSMNVKSFKFINDVKENGEKASKIYGFIAEELHELGLQELVIYEELEDGTVRPDGIREDSISAATYWLVKVQANKINDLEDRIAILEAS